MASVNYSSGSTVAGEMLVLTCFITRELDITGNINLQWIGPDGDQVGSMGPVVEGSPMTSGATTSLSLQFTTLFTSHGGEYGCQANLVSQDTMYNVSALQDVIIQGEGHTCFIST